MQAADTRWPAPQASRPNLSIESGRLDVHMEEDTGPAYSSPPRSEHRHRLPPGHRVRHNAVLDGLHPEYWLEKVAA